MPPCPLPALAEPCRRARCPHWPSPSALRVLNPASRSRRRSFALAHCRLRPAPLSSLWLTNTRTRHSVKLTDGPHHTMPRWSPDGKVLAFLARRPEDGKSEVRVVEYRHLPHVETPPESYTPVPTVTTQAIPPQYDPMNISERLLVVAGGLRRSSPASRARSRPTAASPRSSGRREYRVFPFNWPLFSTVFY